MAVPVREEFGVRELAPCFEQIAAGVIHVSEIVRLAERLHLRTGRCVARLIGSQRLCRDRCRHDDELYALTSSELRDADEIVPGFLLDHIIGPVAGDDLIVPLAGLYGYEAVLLDGLGR